MPDSDENIVALQQIVDRFYKDISLLLQTADSMVRKFGLRPVDNKCFQKVSALDRPSHWQLNLVYRYYNYERRRNWLPFTSVILCDPEKPGIFLPRPLVSAGWYEYEKDRDWYIDFAAVHVWAKDAKDDGSPSIIRPKEWRSYHKDATKATSIAVPLTTIKSTEDLDTRIIRPFVKLLESN